MERGCHCCAVAGCLAQGNLLSGGICTSQRCFFEPARKEFPFRLRNADEIVIVSVILTRSLFKNPAAERWYYKYRAVIVLSSVIFSITNSPCRLCCASLGASLK